MQRTARKQIKRTPTTVAQVPVRLAALRALASLSFAGAPGVEEVLPQALTALASDQDKVVTEAPLALQTQFVATVVCGPYGL